MFSSPLFPPYLPYLFCIYCFSFPLPFAMLSKLLCTFWDEFLCFLRSCILRNVWIFWIMWLCALFILLTALTACFEFNICQIASFFRSAKIYLQNTHRYLHFLWALLGGDHKVIIQNYSLKLYYMGLFKKKKNFFM